MSTRDITLQEVDVLAQEYYQHGGSRVVINEGVLLDDEILFAHGLKTCVILHHYVNPNASRLTCRFYEQMPKKYNDMLLEMGYWQW